METTKKTYRDLNLLSRAIQHSFGSQETKVQKKLVKIHEKIKPHLDSFESQLDELRLDNAATDEKGIVQIEEKGGYKFNKEGIKKLNKDAEALKDKEFDFKLIEIINTDGFENLHFLEGWTNGIVFSPKEEEEEEEL
jgi:hypothetical protein